MNRKIISVIMLLVAVLGVSSAVFAIKMYSQFRGNSDLRAYTVITEYQGSNVKGKKSDNVSVTTTEKPKADNFTVSGNDTQKLIDAVRENNLTLVNMILINKINVNVCDATYGTPLFAARNSNFEIIKLLLDYGADVEYSDVGCDTIFSVIKTNPTLYKFIVNSAIERNILKIKQNYPAIGESLANLDKNRVVERLSYLISIDLEKSIPKSYHMDTAYLENGVTPLSIASEYGYTAVVAELLNAGVNPEGVSPQNKGVIYNLMPAILYASINNNWDIVNLLLNKGANPNVVSYYKMSPLAYAAESNNFEMVKKLVAKGADVDAINNSKPPLSFATKNNNFEMVKFFVDKGAKFTTNNGEMQIPIVFNISYKSKNIIDYLKRRGAKVKVIEGECRGELLNAAKNNNLTLLKEMVAKGQDVNCSQTIPTRFDADGNYRLSPLLYAISNNNMEIFTYLIERKADANAYYIGKDYEMNDIILGNTPLIAAAKIGNFEMVKMLVENGAYINLVTNYYIKGEFIPSTAAIKAIESKNQDIVDYLINKGANIRSSYGIDKTALIKIISDGDLDYIKYMETKGIKPYVQPSVNCKDLFLVAIGSGKLEMVKHFAECGGNPNAIDGATKINMFDVAANLPDSNTEKDDIIRLVQNSVFNFYINKIENINSKLAVVFRKHRNDEGVSEILAQMFNKYPYCMEFSVKRQLFFPRNTTPLMMASYFGYDAMVKELIAQKVDIFAGNEAGVTALGYAYDANSKEVIKTLEKYGAKDKLNTNMDKEIYSRCETL